MASKSIMRAPLPLPSPSSASFSSPSASPQWKYDVFLSFRGEDTRANFIDHLNGALRQKGILVFKDDLDLERGKPISDEILKAIEESRFSIVVFSKNYASSVWCLEELVKICECMKLRRQTVFPVFYGVDPSEVRTQAAGMYGEAFTQHEQVFRDELDKLQRWRSAMTELASLSGWDLKNNRHEFELIQEIVHQMLTSLRKSSLLFAIEAGDYIGMDSHLEKISSHLNTNQLDDVRIIGICGMGGIGKSTLAKFVYNTIACQFEDSSFLENIRVVEQRHGIVYLQEQLLSQLLGIDKMRVWSAHEGMNEIKNRICRKRVLVILDNVDQQSQLESLAGSSRWFGIGSRIIVTTRDESLLRRHGVDEIYRMEQLDHDQALKLFHLRAFKDGHPAEGYEELSRDFVHYTSRLPLALVVLGSHLYGKSMKEWRSAFSKLKRIPNTDILENLQISFENLDRIEKKIFLDIACFFVGEDIHFVLKVLESCEFYPDIGLQILIDKSLISISQSKVWMHDLVQQMGQEIVRREHEDPGQRSRIWLYEDVRHMLANETGTDRIEAIVLNSNESQEDHRSLSAKSFLRIKKMRLLRLQNLSLLKGLDHLSNEMRYLEWHGYPFKSLPSSFQPEKLVELHMCHSKVVHLWKEVQPLQMLKVINLSHSSKLIKTPDFREVPNLKQLILEGCISLYEVHQSVGVLSKLVLLNLKDCESLQKLPTSLCYLKSLRTLILNGCSKLHKLPDRLGELTGLEVLALGRRQDGKRQQPSTAKWDFLLHPWKLLGSSWKDPSTMAPLVLPSLSTLHCLRRLHLSYCKLKEGAIPCDMGCFPFLEVLDLRGNDFETLPASIIKLSKLEEIFFVDCKRLQSLPDLPPSIQHLWMDGCTSLESLPGSISGLSKLEGLYLEASKSLVPLPNFPSSMSRLFVDESSSTSPEAFPCSTAGTFSRKGLTMGFINGPKLVELLSAFAWLNGRVQVVQIKNRDQIQGFLGCIESALTSESDGFGTVPRWFNYVSTAPSLKLEPPPQWCNDDCLGFCIWVSRQVLDHTFNAIHFHADLYAWISEETRVLVASILPRLPGTFPATSDVVSCAFFPIDNHSKSMNWWNSCKNLEVSPVMSGFELKSMGFRIVYKQDFEELGQCSRPKCNSAETSKRIQADRWDEDDEGVPTNKRLRRA